MRESLVQIIETYNRMDRDAQGIVKLTIDGQDKFYSIVAEEHGLKIRELDSWFLNYELVWKTKLREINTIKLPSKEEIAAKESVVKAEVALEAAKNALKIIKEKQL